MITLSTPLFTCLAMFAVVGLLNIITSVVIVFGGRYSLTADPAIDQNMPESSAKSAAELYNAAVERAREECECPCHSRSMQPGLRCMDCYNSICDEGTAQ